MELSTTWLVTLLPQIPVFLVWLVALILALVFWKRHPTVSLLVFIALVTFGVRALVDTYLVSWLPLQASQMGWSAQQIATFYGIKAIVDGLCSALGWALIVVAVFGWRKKISPPATPPTPNVSQPQ